MAGQGRQRLDFSIPGLRTEREKRGRRSTRRGGCGDLSSLKAPLLWVSQQVSEFHVCSGTILPDARAPRDEAFMTTEAEGGGNRSFRAWTGIIEMDISLRVPDCLGMPADVLPPKLSLAAR